MKYQDAFVYLIKNELTNHYKIGVAVDIQSRLKNLQSGSSSKLSVVKAVKSTQAYALERELHIKFKHRRLEGEWFNLSETDLLEFDSFIQRMDTINSSNFSNVVLKKKIKKW